MQRSSAVPEEKPLTPAQITFAQNLLPFDYSEVTDLTSSNKNLLFATQKSGTAYSEFHMAAGERTLFRISKDIVQLRDALVLVDEIEAGLHPWVQRTLMLHLQQLALRNDLQIIVTSHSPIILDSVPPEGRIFLDRDRDGNVVLNPPYRDIIQNAFYGRQQDRINVLCEDHAAEAILRGVIDDLAAEGNFMHESVQIDAIQVQMNSPRILPQFANSIRWKISYLYSMATSGIQTWLRGCGGMHPTTIFRSFICPPILLLKFGFGND